MIYKGKIFANEKIYKWRSLWGTGFILLKYKDNYLVVINKTDNFDNNIVGWVDKKYFRKEFD